MTTVGSGFGGRSLSHTGQTVRQDRSGCFSIRTFTRDRTASAAIEFSFLLLPFILILFAILEISMVFVGQISLDHQVSRMTRLVRIGEIAKTNTSEAEFRRELCDPVSYLFDCKRLQIDLKTYASFDDLPKKPPVENGGLNNSGFRYEIGAAGKTMALRVFYEWPTYTRLMGGFLPNLTNGTYLMASTNVFKTEPF